MMANPNKLNQLSIRNELQKKFFNKTLKHEKPSKLPKRYFIRKINFFFFIFQKSDKSGRSKQYLKGKFQERYQMGHVIGQGAHGLVRYLDDNTAVKICRSGDPELVNTFIDEFKNCKQLNHEYIMKCYECFVDENTETLYMTMELCDMPTLAQILKNKMIKYFFRKIYKFQKSEDQAKAITKSLLTAVKHMHEKGIAHRDLKPDNIMLIKKTDPGQEFYPIKVIDFGVSRKYKVLENQNLIDRDMWTRTGNAYYCAPEIFNGGGYDHKVDIWAVGVILYQMLLGKLPFYNESVSDLIENIIQGQLDISSLKLDYRLKDLLKRLLNPNPSSRLNAVSNNYILKNINNIVALQHPWFYCAIRFDPISPSTDERKPHRASVDLEELYIPHERSPHQRCNTMSKSISTQDTQNIRSPKEFLEAQGDNIESESPLIRLKKIENVINRQIHIHKKPTDQIVNYGAARIRLKLLDKQNLNTINE